MGKESKSISLDTWIIEEIKKQHPRSRRNFSLVVNAMLRAVLNNPLQYWKAQAKLYQQQLHSALYHVEGLQELAEAKQEQHNSDVEKVLTH